jgi:hypothetical protein
VAKKGNSAFPDFACASSGLPIFYRVIIHPAVEKAAECFERLSMNGISSMISNLPVRPEQLSRRTPSEIFKSLPSIDLLWLTSRRVDSD